MPSPEPPIGDDPVRAAFHDALQATPEPADLDLRADLGAVVGRARSRRRRRRGLTVVAAATAIALLAGGVALAASAGDDGRTSEVLAGDGDTTPEPTTVPSPGCLVPPPEELVVPDTPLQFELQAGPDVAPGGSLPFAVVGDELDGALVEWGTAVAEWWNGTAWVHGHEVGDLFAVGQPSGVGMRTFPSIGAIAVPDAVPHAWYRLTVPVTWDREGDSEGDFGGTWGGFEIQAFWSVACTPANTPDPDAELDGCTFSDVDVFLEPGVEAAQVEAVRDALLALEQEGVVSSVTYLDAQASYMEFQRRFADQPEILAGVEPGDVPTAFVVDVVITEAERVRTEVEGLPGVGQVLDAFDPMTCGTSWWLGDPETCEDLLASTTTTTEQSFSEYLLCAELEVSATASPPTSAPDETCDDVFATTTTAPPDADHSVVILCVEGDGDASTTTTTTGPAGPEGGCPVVDLEAGTVRGLLGGPVGDRLVIDISWSTDRPEAPVVLTASVDGVVLGSTGYDPNDPPPWLPGIVTLFRPAYPDLVIGVLADDHVLLPPGVSSYDGRTWQPSVVTDRIDELGGRLFAAAPSPSDPIAATPSPGHRYQTCTGPTDGPR